MEKVLIVDDEKQNLKSLQKYLDANLADCEVLVAKNEADAKSMISKHQFSLVITDLVMTSDEGGIEILTAARAADPLTMVLVITAFDKKLDRYRAFALGAFDCVQKNTPGLIAAEEILVKSRAALSYRQITQGQIASQSRLEFLRRYFDPRVFGIIESDPKKLELQNKIVTVCFWDIRGFSLISDVLKAHPELIAGFLQDYFKVAAEIIFQHQGVLDKFIGDGVMALFGALESSTDDGAGDAKSAIEAALELRTRFDQIARGWAEKWNRHVPNRLDFGLGAGIHTGEALVGNVGTSIRDQYTALGPHVNFAQRLESKAERGQILISAPTEARVRGAFNLLTGAVISAKNIPGEFQTFVVQSRT